MSYNHLQANPQRYDLDPTLEPERGQTADRGISTTTAPQPERPAARRPGGPTPAGDATLLDPRIVDRTLPAAKAIAAALGWINSVATTVLTARDVQSFITDQPPTGIALVAGFGFAALLTFGQIYTSGRYRKTYAMFLFPDALMTSIQWSKWLLLPLFLKLVPAWWLAVMIAAVIGGIIGIISARTPERLTFGVRQWK